MKIYYLNGFNNYYNRKIIKYEALIDYIPEDADFGIDYFYEQAINFNPNDGVSATHICNFTGRDGEQKIVYFDWTPNYALVVDDEGNIISRWFIMEFVRTRQGQYSVSLRRDVIADNLTNILASKAYIEKGTIIDSTNSLIYKSENLSVSEIKKQEILLKDYTEIPWVVIYLAKGLVGNDTTAIQIKDENIFSYIDTGVSDITQWDYYDLISNPALTLTNFDLRFHTQGKTITVREGEALSRNNSQLFGWLIKPQDMTDIDLQLQLYYHFKNNYFQARTNIINDYGLEYSVDEILELDGKVIRVGPDNGGDYHYYNVSVKQGTGPVVDGWVTQSRPSVVESMTDIWNQATGQEKDFTQAPDTNTYGIKYETTATQISIEEITPVVAETTLHTLGTKSTTNDTPLFDIIAIPAGDMAIKITSGLSQKTFVASKDLALKTAAAIGKSLTSTKVYDIQLLPYCPIAEIYSEPIIAGPQPDPELKINLLPFLTDNTLNDNRVLLFKDSSDNIISAAVTSTVSNRTFEFKKRTYEPLTRKFTYKNIMSSDSSGFDSLIEYKKFDNDCVKYRLCSPNYSGLFDFSLQKNGGSIESMICHISYKPYTPFIHVAPKFANLYGSNFDDVRGLICGGDFSIGIINDAWQQYQVQNKNYQAIFDRNIQNMDASYQIGATGTYTLGFYNSLMGAVAGGGAGALKGGGAGAAVGAGATLIGGITNTLISGGLQGEQYKENRDFAIDKFNLELANVKALPQSISKTDPYNDTNKLFPFIEIYECTEEEKAAYLNKLKYDGMTIGVIDDISNWVSLDGSRYLKAQLIRCESLSEDNHMLNEISIELAKGLYL